MIMEIEVEKGAALPALAEALGWDLDTLIQANGGSQLMLVMSILWRADFCSVVKQTISVSQDGDAVLVIVIAMLI